MTTKKMLAPFDFNNPDKSINGFLYPNIDEEHINSFLEINKGKKWKTGMVVFVGREVSKNDIFAKIIDSRKKIKSVSNTLELIQKYINQVKQYKIGDILAIKSSSDGFELIKLERPKRPKSKIP